MTRDATFNSPNDGAASGLLVRSLIARYVCLLALVAALVVLDQAVIQPSLVALNSFAPAINLAGRQRMLSQRVTMIALALQAADNDDARQSRRSELQSTLEQWKAAEASLSRSGASGSQSSELIAAWTELAPHFQAMCAAAERVLRTTAVSPSTAAEMNAAIGQLLLHEPEYLPTMERIVKLLQDASLGQIWQLRCESMLISAAVLALLVGLGWFVVVPAARTIRAQVDGLEGRVAKRTRELSDVNVALEREIAEHQQAELEKQRLSRQLAHAARISSIGHLTTAMAHEINQPLTAIANFSDACSLLVNEQARPDTRIADLLAQVRAAALRAGNIVRRIRNFARPTASTSAATSLRGLVRDVVDLCHFELERAEVRLTLDFGPDDELVVVDAIQIQQVLVNLIENAIQALRSSSPALRAISISAHPVDGMVEVEVSDTGPGFGPRDPESVFAPYFTTKEDGLGIGLSLSRSIIVGHGGEIWAESASSGGATIRFTLPRITSTDDASETSTDCVCRR